jgi:hypothetical protein
LPGASQGSFLAPDDLVSSLVEEDPVALGLAAIDEVAVITSPREVPMHCSEPRTLGQAISVVAHTAPAPRAKSVVYRKVKAIALRIRLLSRLCGQKKTGSVGLDDLQ